MDIIVTKCKTMFLRKTRIHNHVLPRTKLTHYFIEFRKLYSLARKKKKGLGTDLGTFWLMCSISYPYFPKEL